MKFVIILSCIFLVFVQGEESSCPQSNEINKSKTVDLPKGNQTLQLIVVILRHGNRTTTGIRELYPNDPYLNYTYFPLGHGQLTNTGKAKAFLVGTSLRKRYDKFLGKFYYPNIVEAHTTDRDRTKTTLQLALAGLFPPTPKEVTATGLSWQPIPFQYVPYNEDKILAGVSYCSKYNDVYQKYISLPKIQEKFKSYQETFDYISKHSGLEIKTLEQVCRLSIGISTEEEYGLKLPAWLNSIWPDTIKRLAVEQYSITMGYLDMRRMAVGHFLKKLLDDINSKITDPVDPPRKVHIYAAHELNLAQLLLSLKVFEKHMPTYGAYIVFELHKVNDLYGIKLFYESWDGRGLRLLKMPNCEEFCPLEEFKELISDILPVRGLCD